MEGETLALFCDSILTLFYTQRYPTDKAYFIAKEILTTERTYLKDLEVLTVVSYPGYNWCRFAFYINLKT